MGRPALGRREGQRDALAWWWWWRYNVRWGRVSALRFHLCNLPSIVRDYYQLFNYSDDIYQGQLYRAASCRENGLSVLLLHSQAGECAAEAVQVGLEEGTFSWTCFFSGSVPCPVTRVAINCPTWFQQQCSLFMFIRFGCHITPAKHSPLSPSLMSTSLYHYSNANTLEKTGLQLLYYTRWCTTVSSTKGGGGTMEFSSG